MSRFRCLMARENVMVKALSGDKKKKKKSMVQALCGHKKKCHSSSAWWRKINKYMVQTPSGDRKWHGSSAWWGPKMTRSKRLVGTENDTVQTFGRDRKWHGSSIWWGQKMTWFKCLMAIVCDKVHALNNGDTLKATKFCRSMAINQIDPFHGARPK